MAPEWAALSALIGIGVMLAVIAVVAIAVCIILWRRRRPQQAKTPAPAVDPVAEAATPAPETTEAPAIPATNNLFNLTEEQVVVLEREAGGGLPAANGQAPRMQATVAQILSWQQRAAGEKASVARTVRAAGAVEGILGETIRDQKDSAAGRQTIAAKVTVINDLAAQVQRGPIVAPAPVEPAATAEPAIEATTLAPASADAEADEAALLEEARQIVGGV